MGIIRKNVTIYGTKNDNFASEISIYLFFLVRGCIRNPNKFFAKAKFVSVSNLLVPTQARKKYINTNLSRYTKSHKALLKKHRGEHCLFVAAKKLLT